jgi:ankyrin repeat protein
MASFPIPFRRSFEVSPAGWGIAVAVLVQAAAAVGQIEVIPDSELAPGAKFAVAIERGDLDEVRALLDAGLPADTRIDYGEHFSYPLMKACWEGDAAIVRLLLERGADVDARSEDGGAAIFDAVSRERAEIVGILLAAGADPNVVNVYMQSPLSNAVAAAQVEIVEALLRAKAKQELPGLVLTPLVHAVFAGNGDMVRRLVRHGARIDHASEYGQTALSSAITAGKPEMVALLIELGANVNQKAPDGATPLAMARDGDQEDVARMLIAAGAKE